MKKIILISSIIVLLAGSAFAYYEAGGRCTGSDNCRACKNCNYCKHCAKDGGTCGVCKR